MAPLRSAGLTTALALCLLPVGCSTGPDFPAGQWTTTGGGAEFVFTFHDDGTAVVTMGSGLLDQQQVDSSTYRVAGDTLRFVTDTYCRATGGAEEGAYRWRVEGGELRLTAIEDPCIEREALLADAALQRPPQTSPWPTAAPAVAAPAPWWNDEVFYEVFVRSYADSNGDGIGDLQGLIGKLDYIRDLGATALWLMPIMASPSYHGYDTTDYYTVESDYGTNTDFAELMAAAHERGMKVIVDLVLNHTSSEHPWAQDAVSGPQSEKRDWYSWSDTDTGQSTPWGTPVWHPSDTGYYLGLFWAGMPDLNYRNPAVTAQLEDVARFWLQDMGADGFRLDAVRHLIEEGQSISGTPATHAWLQSWDDYLDTVNPQALTVGEVWDGTPVVVQYVADDEVDIAFEFSIARGILTAVNTGEAQQYRDAVAGAVGAYPAGQFAPFLTNHDQNRVMSQLSGDVSKAKLAASALLTLPGVPFLYYGEEIGMRGAKPDERIRTPMQWDASPGAGFTTGTPWEALNGDAAAVNVASEAADPDSLLAHYRDLLRARAEHPALRTGSFLPLDSSCEDVVSFGRVDGQDAVIVALNFSDREQSGCTISGDVPLPAGTYRDGAAQIVAGDGAQLPALAGRESVVLVRSP